MNVPFLQTATFTGLVSTDEYYTSREWSKAYDIATFYSQNSAILIEQTTFSGLTSLKANNQLKPGQLYIITDFELKWIGLGLYDPQPYKSSGVIEPLIVRALSNNKLDVEAYSALHPEDTVYYDIDATNSYTWRDGGPQAASPPIPEFKGWITRRVNRTTNVDIGWDWRYIKANCCKFNIDTLPLYSASTTYNRFNVVRTSSDKIYYSIQNNNLNNGFSSAWWLPVFSENINVRNEYFPTFERGGGIGAPLFTIYPILSTRTQLPTFNTPSIPINVTIKSGFNNIFLAGGFKDIFIGNTCYNNYTIGSIQGLNAGDNFTNNILYGFNDYNTIGSNFSQNIINGSIVGVYPRSIYYCTFGNNIANNIINHGFFYNVVGDQMTNNVFASFIDNNKFDVITNNNRIGRFYRFNNTGKSFQNNIIDSGFQNNIIDNSCNNNTIGSSFSFNTIGSNFDNNNIGNSCFYNKFGGSCVSNTLSSFFQYNDIANNFSFNNIDTDFINNNIFNNFTSNTVGVAFQLNNIQNDFQTNIISNNFVQNTIANNVSNIDFTGATHVYNSYDTTIFNNANSIIRLSYYNTNDQLVVTDPNA